MLCMGMAFKAAQEIQSYRPEFTKRWFISNPWFKFNPWTKISMIHHLHKLGSHNYCTQGQDTLILHLTLSIKRTLSLLQGDAH